MAGDDRHRFRDADTSWEDCRARRTLAAGDRADHRSARRARGGEYQLLPSATRERLLAAKRNWHELDQLDSALGGYEPDVATLLGQFDPPRRDALEAIAADGLLSTAHAQWTTLAAHVDDLRDYIELGKARARVARDGWGDFVAALLADAVAPEVMVDAFVRAYWARRLEALEADDARALRRRRRHLRALDRANSAGSTASWSRPAPTG